MQTNPDELEVLKIVANRLENAKIPYMVTGSIAAGHRLAIPRHKAATTSIPIGFRYMSVLLSTYHQNRHSHASESMPAQTFGRTGPAE